MQTAAVSDHHSLFFSFQMLGGAVAGLPTSAAAAASAAAVAVAAHKQFHPNSPPLDLDSWKEAFLQQANNNTNGNPNKNVRPHYSGFHLRINKALFM